MKLRLYNAILLRSADEPLCSGELRVDGGIIVGVGAPDKQFHADKEIDCGGNLLMSGFCNAHTHAAMSLFRGIADDLPLDKWLFDRICPMEEYLT